MVDLKRRHVVVDEDQLRLRLEGGTPIVGSRSETFWSLPILNKHMARRGGIKL